MLAAVRGLFVEKKDAFFAATPVPTPNRSDENGFAVETQTTENKKSTYEAEYTLSTPECFVKITSLFVKEDIHLVIRGTHYNRVTLRAFNQKSDSWEDRQCQFKTNVGRTPYHDSGETNFANDETIVTWTDQRKVMTKRKWFAGGNRITIDLRNPGYYELIVPHDCELDVTLMKALIVYAIPKSARSTLMTVDAPRTRGEISHFQHDDHQFLPITSLRVKEGAIYYYEYGNPLPGVEYYTEDERNNGITWLSTPLGPETTISVYANDDDEEMWKNIRRAFFASTFDCNVATKRLQELKSPEYAIIVVKDGAATEIHYFMQ